MKKSLILFATLAFMAPAVFAQSNQFDTIKTRHAQVFEDLSTSKLVISGGLYLTPDAATYTAVSTSTKLNSYGKNFLVINGTGTITMGSAPTISTTSVTNGKILFIMGGTNPITFSDGGTLTNSALSLGSATRAVGSGDILELIFYSGKWREFGFVNNI